VQFFPKKWEKNASREPFEFCIDPETNKNICDISCHGGDHQKIYLKAELDSPNEELYVAILFSFFDLNMRF